MFVFEMYMQCDSRCPCYHLYLFIFDLLDFVIMSLTSHKTSTPYLTAPFDSPSTIQFAVQPCFMDRYQWRQETSGSSTAGNVLDGVEGPICCLTPT